MFPFYSRCMFLGNLFPFIFLIMFQTSCGGVSGVSWLQYFLQVSLLAVFMHLFALAAHLLYSMMLAMDGLRSIVLLALLLCATAFEHWGVHQGLQNLVFVWLLVFLKCWFDVSIMDLVKA